MRNRNITHQLLTVTALKINPKTLRQTIRTIVRMFTDISMFISETTNFRFYFFLSPFIYTINIFVSDHPASDICFYVSRDLGGIKINILNIQRVYREGPTKEIFFKYLFQNIDTQ